MGVEKRIQKERLRGWVGGDILKLSIRIFAEAKKVDQRGKKEGTFLSRFQQRVIEDSHNRKQDYCSMEQLK